MVASLFAQLSVFGSNASSDQLATDKARPSPQSTRRRLMFTNKIFHGEAFYLDLRTTNGSRVRGQLEDDVSTLGGRVEPFLSKEITHLITDRVDLLSASGSPTVSTTKTSSSPALFSRAQALLNRSKTKQEQQKTANSTDPVALAKQWGVRIITLQKILSIIEKEKLKCDPSRKSRSSKVGSKIAVRCRKLEGAFIKVEDLSSEFKPTSKNFPSFPVIDLYNPAIEHNQSPFVTRKKKPDVDAAIAKAIPNEEGQKKGTTGNVAKADVPNAVLTPKAGATAKCMAKSKPLGGYCESCDKQYQSLKEHINSDAHKKFAEDRQNFLELDSVVMKLPGLEQLMMSLQVSTTNQVEVKNEPLASDNEEPMETQMDLADGGVSEADKGLVTPIKVEQSRLTEEDCGPIPMAVVQPNATVPIIASNVSSNDATMPYAGPTLVTSQTERDTTLPYERPTGGESSQDEKDITLPYEETSQSEKDKTLPYGEDQCHASSQEDVSYNQLDVSVTANQSLPTDNMGSTLNGIGITQNIKVENHASSEGKVPVRISAERTLVKAEVRCSSPTQENLVLVHAESGHLESSTGQCQHTSPRAVKSANGVAQSELNVASHLSEGKSVNGSEVHPVSLPCQEPGTSHRDQGIGDPASLSAMSEPSSSVHEDTMTEQGSNVDPAQMVTGIDLAAMAKYVNIPEDISNDEFDTLAHAPAPLPSESNGTIQEPFSSRGEYFDVSPVKLLTQFPFNFTGNRSDESRDSVIASAVPSEGAARSIRSHDDQTRGSLSGFDIVSENSNIQPVRNGQGAPQNFNNIPTPESNMDSQPSLVNASVDVNGTVHTRFGETFLPESSASDASLYPTSFSNILSNLSAGSLPYNKDLSTATSLSLLVQGNESQTPIAFNSTPTVNIMNQMPVLHQPAQNYESPMDCGQSSSDPVENSIAMNLMAKLQNQDLNSSDSGSESDGFFNGNPGPASFDLDPMDLVSNKNDIGIDDVLSRDTVVGASRSTNTIVFPLDVNSHIAGDSHSSVLPQIYEGQRMETSVEAAPSVPVSKETLPEPVDNSLDPSSPDPCPSHLETEDNVSEASNEEDGNRFTGFDLNQTRYPQLSFAALAKSANVLPTFQQTNRPSIPAAFSDSSGENNALFGVDCGESNRLFSNCPSMFGEGSNTKPWSPSSILNFTTKADQPPSQDENMKSQNSATELSKGPYISPVKSKVVSSKAKKEKSKPKKTSRKKEKETSAGDETKKGEQKKSREGHKREKIQEIQENIPIDYNVPTDVNRLTPEDSGKVKKSRKKSKDAKEEKPKKSKRKESKSKSDVPASPLPVLGYAPKCETPKTSSNNLESGNSVWVATPTRGLKIKLCRVVAMPGRPKPDGENSEGELGVERLDEKPKRSKSKKSDKSEKTSRRRKLEYSTDIS